MPDTSTISLPLHLGVLVNPPPDIQATVSFLQHECQDWVPSPARPSDIQNSVEARVCDVDRFRWVAGGSNDWVICDHPADGIDPQSMVFVVQAAGQLMMQVTNAQLMAAIDKLSMRVEIMAGVIDALASLVTVTLDEFQKSDPDNSEDPLPPQLLKALIRVDEARHG